MHDAFITGLLSNSIHQCLLEKSTLELEAMFTQARSLDIAQKSFENYVTLNSPSLPTAVATSPPVGSPEDRAESTIIMIVASSHVLLLWLSQGSSLPMPS